MKSKPIIETDKVDSLKLSRSLRNGELEGIYVHNKSNHEDRTLIKARESLVKDQTYNKKQDKGIDEIFRS